MGTVSHKLNSDDVLANTITALEILKSTSDAISMVPLLGAVLGAALSLVSTIDRVRGDRDRSIRLAKRVSNLMMQVERSVASSRNALDDENMATSLAALQSTLMGIQEDLEALAKRTILFRFLHRGSMARRLEEHLERLDDVSRLFTIDCLVALRSKMALSTQYDDQQIRLLRFCDIKLQRNCGEWHSRYGVSGDEWSGEWEGRAVSIRILRGDNSTEHTLRSLVTSLPICHYPYIAQIVGKSHPSVSSRFYVLERGPVSVCHYASVVVSLKKLRWYLQMYVDYEETFRYLQSLNFPLARTGEAHTHDHCLPSLAIKEDGTLLLSAEDLVSRNLDCLAQTFRDLFRDGDRVFEVCDVSFLAGMNSDPISSRQTDRHSIQLPRTHALFFLLFSPMWIAPW
ncbi:hypothetical protein OBBRIDRAFT_220895 [Obba rivulosa]|uniref:Mixed lineage kinase domain-containing protein n=1 Tax=Obba rivulosa TaxID=1052685 RepID=A0A8E2ARB5_9APHY|nr:hypothetical protein OBBRIDRAFT_220895 [Obba rivulosa]